MTFTRSQIRPSTDQIIDWLLAEENRRICHSEMVQGLAERLVACGIPLSSLSSSQQTYQSEVSVRNARWRAGQGTQVEEYDYDVTEGDGYLLSPLFASRELGKPIRVKLTGPVDELPYPICRTLAKGGATDYYLFTLPREFGAFVSFASDAEEGFCDEDIAIFDSLRGAVGLRLELYTARHGLDQLLHLYLGRNAATQVMNGSFRLGKREDIEAVIWMCDLRGFTSMTESNSIDQVLETLNQYFDCVVEPIRSHGGEVLKFIGDAVLAIFPVAPGCETSVCTQALEAAREAFGALDKTNEERAKHKQPPFQFGLGLHLGTVSYGNIGAKDRLDFTVIGPAVNETARIEGLCSKLGESLVLSETFAMHASQELHSLGKHELKGVKTPPEIFTHR